MDREERKLRRDEMRKQMYSGGGNRMWSGLLLLAAGGLLLARQVGADLPAWMFHWHMILIAIGLLISFKSGFKNVGGLIMIVVGIAFLLNDIIPDAHMQDFIWPGILIIAGIIFIVKPKPNIHHLRNYGWDEHKWKQQFGKWDSYEDVTKPQPATANIEDDIDAEWIEINAVFGSANKLVLSKNFKGGEVNAFMGGAEINLLQADMKQPIQLEINTVFGGTKLIVPSNWNIKNSITAVLGGLEDKRNPNIAIPDPNKILILKGACVFGGIEIKNF